MTERDTIFISHATPHDNAFVHWLSSRLVERGYRVWADVLQLKGGTPFWSVIEDVLRNRAVKVIFVVSRQSIDPARGGVRNELSVADGLRRSLGDPGFIVPVRIDDTPFDELPIQIHQLNALDFSGDREERFADLIDTLETQSVPRASVDAGTVVTSAPPVAVEATSAPSVVPVAPQRDPSIAVLPFQNLSSDPEQDYFADGVVDDILTALSRFRSLRVAARNSSFVYRGRALDVRQVGRELGADYVVEGSVRKAGARLRITAQLVDTSTGAHIWARNYDGALEDVFAFQDSITESVVSIVEPAIVQAEIERARQKPPANPDAYDFYLQALPKVLKEKPGSAVEALELLDRSLALDPRFGRALGLACRATMSLVDNPLPGTDYRERAMGYARRALAIAGADSQMRVFAGLVLIMAGSEYDTGLAAVRHAASVNPNDVSVLASAGVAEMWAGDLAEMAGFLRRALKLNPHEDNAKWINVGLAQIALLGGRFGEALELATRADAIDPDNEIIHWYVIAANARLGRIDEAQRLCRRLRTIAPAASISRLRAGQRLRDPQRIEVLIEGLRAAGLPE